MNKQLSRMSGDSCNRQTSCPSRRARRAALTLCLLLLPQIGHAFLFPEHRDVTVRAIEELNPAQREAFDKLWSEARTAHEARLCADPAASAQPEKPTCIDYASWPAIAGDHSCSANEMLTTVLEAPWILKVAQIGVTLKTELAAAKRRDQQVNAVRDSNLALQRADSDVATRATSNDAHFLLARPKPDIEPAAYAKLTLGAGARLNALGAYAWYHLRAMTQATRIAHGDLTPEERAQAARAVLADEAFATHFLEDAFAAGHVAGNWGNQAVRLGTHDYYNEYGIEAVTWRGKHYIALGDGNMGSEDKERAAAAVRDSLVQVLEALEGKTPEGLGADQATTNSLKHSIFAASRTSRPRWERPLLSRSSSSRSSCKRRCLHWPQARASCLAFAGRSGRSWERRGPRVPRGWTVDSALTRPATVQ